MAQLAPPSPVEEREILAWIRAHAPITMLCEAGGWPDDEHARIDICNKNGYEWIVNITVTESVMEISECDVAEYSRCGKFTVSLDDAGRPEEIRLLYPM
ncbi:MAG TPA: hypothetical protein VJ961_06160 [Mariprofundaceae bacterium]|nr:hypothetical protein [Mariprofundaceae bacterium]